MGARNRGGQVTDTLTVVSTEGPIRRFADTGIQAAIDKAVAGLRPDQTGAVVAVATASEIRLAVVGRIGTHWSALGVLEKPFKGELKAEAALRFAW